MLNDSLLFYEKSGYYSYCEPSMNEQPHSQKYVKISEKRIQRSSRIVSLNSSQKVSSSRMLQNPSIVSLLYERNYLKRCWILLIGGEKNKKNKNTSQIWEVFEKWGYIFILKKLFIWTFFTEVKMSENKGLADSDLIESRLVTSRIHPIPKDRIGVLVQRGFRPRVINPQKHRSFLHSLFYFR